MRVNTCKNVFKESAKNWNCKRNITRNVNTRQATTTEDLKSWRDIPGPTSLPFIGQLHHFLPGAWLHDRLKLQDRLYEAYGPIVRMDKLLGFPTNILIFDPESAGQIFRGENWMPVRPGFFTLKYYRTEHEKENTGSPTGLITDQGENWKKLRSIAGPIMLQPKTVKLYSTALNEVADDTIERLKSKRDKTNMIKDTLETEISLWSLESSGVVALGRRLNCLDPTLPEDSVEKRMIQVVHEAFEVIDEFDFKPSVWRYYHTRAFKKAMKTYEELERLTKYFINKTKEEMVTEKKSDEEKGVLEKLLSIDEEIAVLVANDMLFAGIDTSVHVLLSILYNIATNLEKQNKLRDELKAGDRSFLKACIKESLRLMPAVPGNLRQTTMEYNILGYKIPKDMFVILFHQHMCLREDQYPSAREFLPERWLVDKESPLHYAHAHPFCYSPFGNGARSCIGRRIADLQLEIMVSKMVENFNIKWTGGPPNLVTKTVIAVKPPYNFVFEDIKK